MKIKKIHVVYLLVILFIISLFTIWVFILNNSWSNNVFEGLDVNRTQVIKQNVDGTYTVPNTYLDVSPKFVTSPSAIFLSIRRIILPERVLGKPLTI